jgi:hypothetical protein
VKNPKFLLPTAKKIVRTGSFSLLLEPVLWYRRRESIRHLNPVPCVDLHLVAGTTTCVNQRRSQGQEYSPLSASSLSRTLCQVYRIHPALVHWVHTIWVHTKSSTLTTKSKVVHPTKPNGLSLGLRNFQTPSAEQQLPGDPFIPESRTRIPYPNPVPESRTRIPYPNPRIRCAVKIPSSRVYSEIVATA